MSVVCLAEHVGRRVFADAGAERSCIVPSGRACSDLS